MRRERGADPVWLRHCEHRPVLFVCSIPPYLPSVRLNKPIKKKKKIKSSIIPLISTFITHYFAKKKKEDPIFF